MSLKAAGIRNIERSGAVIMPPTMGAAMRLMISLPAPVPMRIGTSPTTITETVILSCRQIAEYWKLHRPVFKAWFADFPDQDISHDTVRNVIRILGKGDVNKLIEQYTIPLLAKYQTRIVALDGQAVCAA